MKKSKFLSLTAIDFIKGLILSVLSVVVSAIYEITQTGNMPTMQQWNSIATMAFCAFISYLIKNIFTNSNDKFLKRE